MQKQLPEMRAADSARKRDSGCAERVRLRGDTAAHEPPNGFTTAYI